MPSHKIALPIHGLRFLSSRIQLSFPIDFRDRFQACPGIFLAEGPPHQWQPYQQHAAFHFSKSRQVLPPISALFLFFYFIKKEMKWNLGLQNWWLVSLWPHCALFCPLPLPCWPLSNYKVPAILYKKEVHVCHIIFVTCPYPPITWLNERILGLLYCFLSALDIKNIFGPIFLLMRSRNCLLTKCQYMSYTTRWQWNI